MTSQVQETLDHLFRRESGKITAYLTRYFGPDHLDLAENVVQEALIRAVQSWPVKGIPDKPAAWLLQVAKNIAIDHIRSGKFVDFDSESVPDTAHLSAPQNELTFESEIQDDQLKLMFVCCHPVLAPEARIALTLKTICGFGVKEIARSFVAKEETIAQRIVRAKQKIAEAGLRFEVPPPEEMRGRLEAVLDVLYLLFNEGYLATEGDSLLRRDLCEEAIYRTKVLAEHPLGRRPSTLALLALMFFQVSRFNSRVDAAGDLLLLEEQDRSLWDRGQIMEGLRYLEASAEGEELSDFHLQAGIASCHAIAPSFAETNWERILSYYDILFEKEASPVVALNRAVAIAMVNGPVAGLNELDRLNNLPALQSYYLLHATRAELHRRAKQYALAAKNYEKALRFVGTLPERRLIQKRIEECQALNGS